MSTLREAAQQALEALESAHPKPYNEDVRAHYEAITALRAALAQPEPRNQCGETCERATLCAVCAREVEQEEATCKAALQVEPEGGRQSAPSLERRGPVATVENGVLVRSSLKQDYTGPLYTAPPRREQEQEPVALFTKYGPPTMRDRDFWSAGYAAGAARAIEAALKERNT